MNLQSALCTLQSAILRRAAALVLALMFAGLPVGAQAQQQRQQIGGITVAADTLEFDLEKRQFVAKGRVDLVSGESHLTADQMTVQTTPGRQLEWAKCEGNVFIERKNPEDGTRMDARAQTLDFRELERKAFLTGGVVIHQTSPRLAKPAEITGARVEMELDTRKNVVHRGPGAQAKVRVEPKGEESPSGEKKPAPEPVELLADRLEMDGKTQEYVATGKPVMVRPSSRLQARRIRFQVEEKSNDVRVAYAENDVVFDGKGQSGSVVHATGDQGVFDREANEIRLTGTVQATTKDPDDEEPIVYQGDEFTYNTQTRVSRLNKSATGREQARVTLPRGKVEPKKPEEPGAGGAAPPAGNGKKP
jgi:lipopolysaccharide transport protein LptA